MIIYYSYALFFNMLSLSIIICYNILVLATYEGLLLVCIHLEIRRGWYLILGNFRLGLGICNPILCAKYPIYRSNIPHMYLDPRFTLPCGEFVNIVIFLAFLLVMFEPLAHLSAVPNFYHFWLKIHWRMTDTKCWNVFMERHSMQNFHISIQIK